MVKVKSRKDLKVSNKNFSYTFQAEVPVEVNEEHLNVLLSNNYITRI
jgi:hypothetical protein